MIVAGGAAAGLAALFNAPLGGAFFALEVILGSFALEAFGPVVVASVAATVVSRALLGDHTVLEVPRYQLEHLYELPVYALVGLACGAVAVALTRGLGLASTLFDRLPLLPSWLRPALGGLVVGALALEVTPRVLGNGYETVDALVASHVLETGLVVVLAAKLLATSTCLASGGSGGVFGPALFLGAVVGALVGRTVGLVVPIGPVGAYAIVGMAALVAGTTHAPVSMVVMLFEMTDSYRIVLPLLIATSIASVVAKALYAESVDTVLDAVRGVSHPRSHEVAALSSIRVEDVARAIPEAVIDRAMRIEAVIDRFLVARTDVFAVVGKEGRYLGAILLEDLSGLVSEGRGRGAATVAFDVLRTDVPTLTPDATLTSAIEAFHGVTCDALPVVDGVTGTLVGFLDEKEIVAAYRTEILRSELRSSFEPGEAGSVRTEGFDLPAGVALGRVTVPPWLVGKSLVGADLRRRFGVLVLAIRVVGADGVRRKAAPDPLQVLVAGAQLLVVGPTEALRALERGEEPPPVTPEVAEAVTTTSQRLPKGSDL